MSVATPTGAVTAMEELRRLPNALMGGTDVMRAAGKSYLPQEIAESDLSYQNRLKRSFLFNGYGKTVRDMSSKVFAKPIIIGEDLPDDLADDAKNIDLMGRELNVFAHDLFMDGLASGVSYVLVDMDKSALADDGSFVVLTKAESVRLNRRPWVVHVRAEQVLGWRSEVVAGVETLTQFRFMESVSEDAGEFGQQTIPQIRVISRVGNVVSWETFRRREGTIEEWVPHDKGFSTPTVITVAPIYINRTGFMMGEPALSDLAEVNLAHWQSQSDQRNILHVARVPILFGAGFEEKKGQKFEIGGSRMITVTDSKASLMYVEHSGAAIAAGRTDLKDLEFQMQVLGLELLVPRPGGETATAASIDNAKMNTPLAMMAGELRNTLEVVFGFMALYRGIDPETVRNTLTVNTDFGISLRGVQDVTSLITMVAAGIITRELCLQEMKRRGVVAEGVDAEEEIEKALRELTASVDTEDPLGP